MTVSTKRWTNPLRGTTIIAVAILFTFTAGCGRQRLDSKALRKSALPTTLEQDWQRQMLALNPEHPPVPAARLAPLRTQLQHDINRGGGKKQVDAEAVRITFAWLNGPAPDLVIATTDPARYLRHGFGLITRTLATTNNLYVRIVDRQGRRVLEWSHAGNSGALWVKPGLESCSPVGAIGWPSTLPPCQAK